MEKNIKDDLGELISNILDEVFSIAIERNASDNPRVNYTDKGLFALMYMFSNAIMERIYDRMMAAKMDKDDILDQAERFGKEFKLFIYKYTNIDTFEFTNRLISKIDENDSKRNN